MKRFWITLSASLLNLLGGLMGYLKGKSLISLAMGGGFGLLLLICAYFLRKKSQKGYVAALSLLSLLTLFFTFRYIQVQKVWPSGMMMALMLFLLFSLVQSKRECS